MRGVCWLLLSACSSAATVDNAPDTPFDPSELGAWGAGTERVVITTGGGLSMPVQVWYPTDAAAGTPVRYDGLAQGAAYEGAAVTCDSARPLAVFSHGNAGTRYQSAFLTEHLATHGFVVLAPDHPGNTFTDAAPNYGELVIRRPSDLADAVDWLLDEVDDDGSRYHGCVERDAGYAVIGHSFGGYTALAAAGATVDLPGGEQANLGDPRVEAAVALAPWDAGGTLTHGTSEIEVPTLILTGARDQITPLSQVRGLWDPMTVEPRYLGVFPDGGHYSFSPVACLLFQGDGCGPDYLDLDTLTERVNEAVAGFLISGAPALDAPEIEWQTHGG